jgi:2-dehydro-3-deoxygluconokinase
MSVAFRDPEECAFDVVALGEVMLRLDPGDGRIRCASDFQAREGGGEYNVARALASCFGLRSAVITSLVDNEVGHLIDGLIRRGGVDTSMRQWLPFDGIGRTARNPLNFTERGFGLRNPHGVSDRGHSATSMLKPGDIDWDRLFGRAGVRCLHTGGIFTGLSSTTSLVAEEAMLAARRHGVLVCYDLNYRPSLWQDSGGITAARRVTERLLPLVDILIGVAPVVDDTDGSDPRTRSEQVDRVRERFPRIACVAATRRTIHSASRNDWTAWGWCQRTGVLDARGHLDVEIFDRVGSGDGFAAGLLYGLLQGYELDRALNYGMAHGALVMTTAGDTSCAILQEVEDLAEADLTPTFLR